ncbi:MAG: hypothetical protein CYPHOPRED_000634 [Cyphobasidiales sp. Tagirdzhanova-0007]|nr:MAG: hypothetical protein CYPHOPRED_000634 [Cyphobasidiales sp. Tagirdzhanova-0007]
MSILRSYSARAFTTASKLRPSSIQSVLIVGASTIAGGLSIALYNRGSTSTLSGFAPFNKLGNSFSSSSKMPAADYPLKKSEEEWRAQLSPEQFRILRKKGTEMAGTGEYDKMVSSNSPTRVYLIAPVATPPSTPTTLSFNLTVDGQLLLGLFLDQ